MKNIILDTDLDTDCDDAAALAVLHSLQAERLCKIAAVICDAPVKHASFCAGIINTFYGSSDIPVGALDLDNFSTRDCFDLYFRHRTKCKDAGILYNEKIVNDYSDLLSQTLIPEDAVAVYRKTLALADDNSIDICSIGLLNVLADLIDSEPCDFSPLNGAELIRHKVDRLVVMGKGFFPSGRDTFNWLMAPNAAAHVFNNWPGKIIISPEGDSVFSGKSLLEADRHNPVADAYKIYLSNTPGRLRPSWDPLVVLYTAGVQPECFELLLGYSFRYDPESGVHEWIKSSDNNIFLLKSRVNNKHLEAMVEHFLSFSPSSTSCSKLLV